MTVVEKGRQRTGRKKSGQLTGMVLAAPVLAGVIVFFLIPLEL